MRHREEHEWTTPEIEQSKITLLRYLEKLELIDSDIAATYLETLTDHLPVQHFAIAGYVCEVEVVEKLARELGLTVGSISRDQFSSISHLLDTEPCNKMETGRWKEKKMAPVEVSNSCVSVAAANPFDYEFIRELEFTFGRQIKVLITPEREIRAVLDDKLSVTDKDAIDYIVKDLKQPQRLVQTSQTPSAYETCATSNDANTAPVIRLVNKIFSLAIHYGASDLHVTPQQQHLLVKIRVDGIIRPLFQIPKELQDPVISRIKLLCGMDIAEKRLPQDGRFRIKTPVGVKDTRLSTVPSNYGENIVARLLSTTVVGLSYDSLGMPAEVQHNFERIIRGSSRVNLVTGPTGSGKTSTLYTGLLDLIDGQTNIITLEDPIEYRIDGITQIQIDPKLKLSFAEGLRSILRQDPDVVMVGEIRDEETASISMKVAQTGHIVLSTLHTNSAPAAIVRLRDLGVPSYLIASSLGSVMAQRLVRTLCPDCAVTCTDETSSTLKGLSITPELAKMAAGCDECGHCGYLGRKGIFSLLEITDAVQDAIRSDASEAEIARCARADGFKTLREMAVALIEDGSTSLEEVERVLGPFIPGQMPDSCQDSDGSQRSSAAGSPVSRPRVLLVEDDADARDVFRMYLESDRFEVEEAANGLEALDCMYDNLPDLIISDIMMPQMDGFQLLQRIRSDRRIRDIPVLMLTANATEETELKMMTSGADDFVSKTSKLDILGARVRRLVG